MFLADGYVDKILKVLFTINGPENPHLQPQKCFGISVRNRCEVISADPLLKGHGVVFIELFFEDDRIIISFG
jgi:hypothetical protein